MLEMSDCSGIPRKEDFWPVDKTIELESIVSSMFWQKSSYLFDADGPVDVKFVESKLLILSLSTSMIVEQSVI